MSVRRRRLSAFEDGAKGCSSAHDVPSMKMLVESYAGYRGEEEPLAFRAALA